VDALTSAYIVGAALLIATPSLIFFGWLSDQIGRKPVILGGMLLAAITYYPLYLWLGAVTQPGNINYPIAIFIIFILVCYVGMVYGPVGAFLAEYFPGRIRYTSVSVPYHIGNGWVGGLVPFITSSAFAATGSIGYALIYPIAVPAVCFVLAPLPNAGDSQNQHLATDRAQNRVVTRSPICGAAGPCTRVPLPRPRADHGRAKGSGNYSSQLAG